MRLSKVNIKNFRNFVNEEININEKTLIVGPNDVGKTNLLYAIRMLLDRNLSINDLYFDDNDLNVFSNESKIEIILTFSDIKEKEDSFVYAKLGKYIKDEELTIGYKSFKESVDPGQIYIGHINDFGKMEEVNGRTAYISTINCVYLDSTRQLTKYLNLAKGRMIENYRNNREPKEIDLDTVIENEVSLKIGELNKKIEEASYIKKSTSFLTEELKEASYHNDDINIKLVSQNDQSSLSKNIQLTNEISGKNVCIGGDGRNNQIYMSIWLNETQNISKEKAQFTIYMIEEPESHLFLPLQVTTLNRLLSFDQTQFLITTHSPQIVIKFPPSSLIRMYFNNEHKISIAKGGCSEKINDTYINFGYRNNLISGAMFFSNYVFLVEGRSEEILYKELLNQLGISLEKYNVAIISVEGVGFEPYTKLLDTLEIPYVVRTDNDIIYNHNKYYYSGVSRLIKIYNSLGTEKIKDNFSGLTKKELTGEQKNDFESTLKLLAKKGLYLSISDLEIDFCNTDVGESIAKNLNMDIEDLIKYLKSKKATRMLEILSNKPDITNLKNDSIYYPIKHIFSNFEDENEANEDRAN